MNIVVLSFCYWVLPRLGDYIFASWFYCIKVHRRLNDEQWRFCKELAWKNADTVWDVFRKINDPIIRKLVWFMLYPAWKCILWYKTTTAIHMAIYSIEKVEA